MEDLRETLQKRIEENHHFFYSHLTKEDIDQIINISISIINTRDQTGPEGGHFVKAVLDNDLDEAVDRADSTCIRALPFFINIKNYFHPTPLSTEDELQTIFNRATKITLSDMSWEEKYDHIFSDEISNRVLQLTDFDYYDPDTSYEDDVWAFMNAFRDKINE